MRFPDSYAGLSGRGWDRTSDLPRVNGELHGQLGVQLAYSAPYGLGMQTNTLRAGIAYGHDGDVPGYRNVV